MNAVRRRTAATISDAPERILAAGIVCFSQNGYAGTTTRELAAAAGVNIAALAYHFGGKEAVYAAVVDRLYDRLLAVDVPLPSEGTVADRVAIVVRLAYRFARLHKGEVRLLLRHTVEHGGLPEQIKKWTDRTLVRAEELWRDMGLPRDPGWKLKLLTLNHLLVRFAISTDADLAPFTSGKDPHKKVEEHLIEVALALLGLQP